MIVRKDSGSPWGRRVVFDDVEFERMMDELRARVPESTFDPGHGVDVDRVLQAALGCEPDFVDLPNGLLGRTKFWPDGRLQIQVSRPLSEEAETSAVARRRLRSTLAHECGHVACHHALMLRDTDTMDLFGRDAPRVDPPTVLCRPESVGDTRYKGEWWEFQANRCMSALLLPRGLLRTWLPDTLNRLGVESMAHAIRTDRGRDVIDDVSDVFDVNSVVVLLRLQELGYMPQPEQREIFSRAT